MTIDILLVEDDPEFSNRFAEAIRSDARLSLIASTATAAAAIAVLGAVEPHVALVDLGLPDAAGVEVIRAAVQRYPNIDVLVVTMFGDDEHILSSIHAGATGYLLKDASMENIVQGIQVAHEGGAPISPRIARRILAQMRPVSAVADGATVKAPLSERELEVLRFVAKGCSFKEVGGYLGISIHTVVAHVKSIYRALAVHSRAEAVYEAGQLGIL